MRDLRSNTRKLWYANAVGAPEPIVDEYGFPNGVGVQSYTTPVLFRANLSATRGTQGFTGTGESNDYFGPDVDYSLIISTSLMNLPLYEDTLIWNTQPVIDEHGQVDANTATFRITAVAKGLRHMKYAVKRLQEVVDGGQDTQNNP